MSEWWSYGLSDFLMFSPEAYWRLLARANAAWWPGQLLGVAAALALPVLVRRDAVRAALLVLALAWAWVGWGFHWRHYGEIFLAAPWLAAACGLQSLLLVAAAGWSGAAAGQPPRAARASGMALMLLALLYPALAPLTGHPFAEAEVVGFMPDPTALATLGALLALPAHGAVRIALALLPTASLLLGVAARWLLA